MDIIETINIINQTYDENKYYRANCSSLKTFCNGYCFDFFLLLKRFFPSAELMMKNDKSYCAALIDENLYDAGGIRYDVNDFHIANGCDYEYIYKMFAMFDLGYKEKFNKLVVKNVLNSNNKFVKTLNK